MKTRLDKFDHKRNFKRGRPDSVFALWYLVKCVFLLSSFPWPSGLKVYCLRLFGAKIGHGVVIKPRVNIHFPWRLEIGSYVWIGEEVVVLNFEDVRLGAHSCVSQQAFLCSGGHDYRDEAFSYRNAPIDIGEGVWLQARVFVCPGVSVGAESVVTTCSLVSKSLPVNMVCTGNPAQACRPRWRS